MSQKNKIPAEPNSEQRPFKYQYLDSSTEAIKQSLAHHLEYSMSKELGSATERDWYSVVALTVRDRMTERWMDSLHSHYQNDAKRVYYLSLEFLMGRTLVNAMLNMGMYDATNAALKELGIELADVLEVEAEAGLGNGGLGRLAACFLDSMATLGLPGFGYGIRYEYGIFRQDIENGEQVEHPDNWLRYDNPWEFARPERIFNVQFGGEVVHFKDEYGNLHHHWVNTHDVMAMAYDTPIPGFQNRTVNTLRLWSAKASRDFDLKYFNKGNYIKAVEAKNRSENISKVLYPEDTTSIGRELRLRQQYFFVCASLQDILHRHHKQHGNYDTLADKVAIQLNDTHPAIAIPELMRLLMDENGYGWDEAWKICTGVFSYTNHTLLPEALESWPVAMFEYLLPRHLSIIYEINRRFLIDVAHHFPGDHERLRRMSLIKEDNERSIRMAWLACVGSHKINGVAALHTQLMHSTIFRDFAEMWPLRFVNVTNGVTPRRWLHQANHKLAELISKHMGCGWLTDLPALKHLQRFADDDEFIRDFQTIKYNNKCRAAEYIKACCGVEIDPKAMMDVQVKRMHEYKRQLLNLLHVITLYNRIRHNPDGRFTPRTVVIAGKAAPGYAMAKQIIHLINDVADTINNDHNVGKRLRLAFLPNYNVSMAEMIIPAADLSEQISTAGKEASGTGNMKFALNGAVTIGTLDGANVEIRDAVGEDNIFIFGMTAEQAEHTARHDYDPWQYYSHNPELRDALNMIRDGYFNPEAPERYQDIFMRLTNGGDPYLLLADFEDYIHAQNKVAAAFEDQRRWTQMAIVNVANMGYFSSDRSIAEYAQNIWGMESVNVHHRVSPEELETTL